MPTTNRYAVLLAAALIAPPALADVYSSEDFRNGLRAYEAIHGGHRQRDPQLEGSAFEFLGYVKALADANNGSSFCVRQDAFPVVVSQVVKQYNGEPAWRDRDPKTMVIGALSRAFPCGTMPVSALR